MSNINEKLEKIVNNVIDKKNIFACNDEQIVAAENLLSREGSTLNTLIQSVIANFTTCSNAFLVNFRLNNTSEENRQNYINAYYQDRCMTFFFIFFVIYVYKTFSKNIFGTLKNAVNGSICNIGIIRSLKGNNVSLIEKQNLESRIEKLQTTIDELQEENTDLKAQVED